MQSKKEVKLKIIDLEDIKSMERYLNEEQMQFLKNIYEIEYDEKTTIRQILNFLINGLKEYYINYNSVEEIFKDYFLKNYSHPIYECGVQLRDLVYFIRTLGAEGGKL